jgi:EAL domain-containing protein (putative c-di-GMP-specific phosphodiesterase class I)
VFWEAPDGRMVPPEDFWSVLEESGLVVDVVYWAIERGLIESGALLQSQLPELMLCHDISVRHLRHPDVLVQQIEKMVKRTGTNLKNILLEVPESALGKDVEGTIRKLKVLRGKGLRLALDHFGTGSSSLRLLRHFPVDMIKIDSSFVSHVLQDENDAAVTAAILALAHQLDMKVLAEGVSSSRHVQFLERYWCDYLQGDHFCKPVTMGQFRSFLDQYLAQFG